MLQGKAGTAAGGGESGAVQAQASGALGQVAGGDALIPGPHVAAVLREGTGGAQACDATDCYPATLATAPAVLVRRGGGYVACLGTAGGLECYPLAGK